VQEGCDKFCSFCVVPYTRGAETSRPVEKILDEIRRLTDAGACEFTLIGQNVNAYHGRDARGRNAKLADLIASAAELPGVLRLRYSTSHPNDMDEGLIRAHAENDKLAPFLHLPVQSGSDRVLAAMNRRHTARDYLAIVERVRRARADVAFSSDFIVGFPGETEADFQATLAMAREVVFASAYAFKFSPRPGTPSAEADDQVPEEVKVARLAALMDVLEPQRHAYNQATVGRSFGVVFDKIGRHPGQRTGKSPYMQSVSAVVPAERVGVMTEVEITGVISNSLIAEMVASAS
jgi:tRNA-2-methylthio-N6-dimethylallyladenosine synthase